MADGLELADCTAAGKVLVRADPDGGMARRLGVACGQAARSVPGALVARFGPDEWLLFAGPGEAGAVASELSGVADDGLVTVLDFTSGRAVVRLTGARGSDLLAKLCPVDAATPPDGTAFRSWVAGVAAEVIRDDVADGRSYLIACDWSFRQYLFDVLLDAGAEFGLAVARPLDP